MRELDYLIVGAGPSGVQMGYFLEKAGRNYLILEKQHTAGAFYTKFPLHRTMISFNKRFNYHPEPDFNMRHDWNSLISDDPALLFKNYSEDLFPHADAFVRYVSDFATKSALKVKYDCAVTSIRKDADGSFVVTDQHGETYRARCLINATGAVAPNVPEMEGAEHATLYKDHSIDRKLYENKRVAIIGAGNTAFEVANHLAGHAAIIHIFSRNPIRHAWQTHFVGDLRSINNTILDMYQLKSLHATLGGRPKKLWREKTGLQLMLEEDLPHWKTPVTEVGVGEYDHVIVCAGWKYVDKALYDESIKPATDAVSKYPQMTTEWESVNVKDMFFIGAAMGGRDKKSASGFIHGFRYNVRTLFRILESRYFGVPHASKEFPMKNADDLHGMADFLLHRISTVSALFQLYGFLCDVMTFDDDGKATIEYELPTDHVLSHPKWKDKKICTMSLEFGFKHYDPTLQSANFIHPADPSDRSCAAFLHPIFRYYDKGVLKAETHVNESLEVRWHDRYYDNDGVAEGSRNIIKNHLNAIAQVTQERFMEFGENFMRPEFMEGEAPPPGVPNDGPTVWSEEKRKMMKVDEIEKQQGQFRCKYANYR